MLEELKRPIPERLTSEAQNIKNSILANYANAKELVELALLNDDDKAFKDLLQVLNYSLDAWDNQIFFDSSAKKILIYDIVNEEFITEEEDIINIIEADY
jgi:hypothetical protein